MEHPEIFANNSVRYYQYLVDTVQELATSYKKRKEAMGMFSSTSQISTPTSESLEIINDEQRSLATESTTLMGKAIELPTTTPMEVKTESDLSTTQLQALSKIAGKHRKGIALRSAIAPSESTTASLRPIIDRPPYRWVERVKLQHARNGEIISRKKTTIPDQGVEFTDVIPWDTLGETMIPTGIRRDEEGTGKAKPSTPPTKDTHNQATTNRKQSLG